MTGVVGNASVARAVVEGFATRDIERLVPLFTPDAEFRTRVDVLGTPHFTGHDGVRAWLESVDEKYDRYEIVDAEYRPGPSDAVFVSCHLRLQFTGDRYGMARQVYWVFRIDESSRVCAFTSFRDLDEALADAGLTE